MALVCTPWAWRHRWAVVALVVGAATLFAAVIVQAFATGRSIGNDAALATINGTATYLLLLRPALRSLRRWNAATTTADAAVGPLVGRAHGR